MFLSAIHLKNIFKNIKTNIEKIYNHLCYKLLYKTLWAIVNYLTCEIKFISLHIKKVLSNLSHKNLL